MTARTLDVAVVQIGELTEDIVDNLSRLVAAVESAATGGGHMPACRKLSLPASEVGGVDIEREVPFRVRAVACDGGAAGHPHRLRLALNTVGSSA